MGTKKKPFPNGRKKDVSIVLIRSCKTVQVLPGYQNSVAEMLLLSEVRKKTRNRLRSASVEVEDIMKCLWSWASTKVELSRRSAYETECGVQKELLKQYLTYETLCLLCVCELVCVIQFLCVYFLLILFFFFVLCFEYFPFSTHATFKYRTPLVYLSLALVLV